MHDFSPNLRRERRNFRRLQHHGATHCQGRCHFACNLIRRPVPWSDETAYANGLFDNERGAALFFKVIVLKYRKRGLQMRDAYRGLCLLREHCRRAHFLGDGSGHIGVALGIFSDDAFKQCRTFFACGLREDAPKSQCHLQFRYRAVLLKEAFGSPVHLENDAERAPVKKTFEAFGVSDVVSVGEESVPANAKPPVAASY